MTRCAHALLYPAGIGDGAFWRTPITTPDRSVAVPAVAFTDTDPEVAMHAEVRTASHAWSAPSEADTAWSAVHPDGASAWVAAVESPHAAAIRNAGPDGAPSARFREVTAAA